MTTTWSGDVMSDTEPECNVESELGMESDVCVRAL